MAQSNITRIENLTRDLANAKATVEHQALSIAELERELAAVTAERDVFALTLARTAVRA